MPAECRGVLTKLQPLSPGKFGANCSVGVMAEPGWRDIHIQQMRLTAISVSSLWTQILETHPPASFLVWFGVLLVFGGFFLVCFLVGWLVLLWFVPSCSVSQ